MKLRKNIASCTRSRRRPLRIVLSMQFQVDYPKPELPHLRVGAPECPCALHLLEQFVGNCFACFVVPREQVQGFAFHAPVLHDLRRQFDEIPGHVGAAESPHRHAAQCVVKQMTEFVEDRFHFAMRQQRRRVADGRSQIAADQSKVRLASHPDYR